MIHTPSNLTFWKHNYQSHDVERFVEDSTGFVGLPRIYHDFKPGHDASFRQKVRQSVPPNYRGVVLGNVSERATHPFARKGRGKSDIAHFARMWKIFEEECPGCQLVNYVMPGVTLWPANKDWEPHFEWSGNGDDESPHWMMWMIAHGGHCSGYDPYDDDQTPDFARQQSIKYANANVELLHRLFPDKPKIATVWHRHSTGKFKYQLINFEEMWEQQLEPYLKAGDITVAWWATLMDNWFRSNGNPHKALFHKHTADEHKAAGVDINNAAECSEYYRKQFVDLAKKISARAKAEGLLKTHVEVAA